MNEEEFDELFSGGSPKKKFFDAVFGGGRGAVEEELELLVAELAYLHRFCEQNGLQSPSAAELLYNGSDELGEVTQSIYLHAAANIISKSNG